MIFAIAVSPTPMVDAALVRLADALKFGVEELDLALVEIGREPLCNRLRGLLHAEEFGRGNVVEVHTLGLELGQRLFGLDARLLALIAARFGDGFTDHL